MTAIAWTENDPVVLSKAISKFMKDNADIYTFKTGVVDGKLVDLKQLTTIASLPSKEELISKLLWVLNAQAQRIVTVINAVPRDLAVVIKQIGEKAPAVRLKRKLKRLRQKQLRQQLRQKHRRLKKLLRQKLKKLRQRKLLPKQRRKPAAEAPAEEAPAEEAAGGGRSSGCGRRRES